MAPSLAERRVWELLTKDFYWELPNSLGVRLYDDPGGQSGPARLQVFELAVATVFAHMRPDYDWYVTPNRPDGGLDFVGSQGFLEDEALGIAAAITVGGQCKKRTTVNDVVAEVAGSLARMSATISPTFFVVALSAPVSTARVVAAREILERSYQRHCHILGRDQIEGLIRDRLPVIHPILDAALDPGEIEELHDYFRAVVPPPSVIKLTAPRRVLAGVPIMVNVQITGSSGAGATYLWWLPSSTDGDFGPVSLLAPLGADTGGGARLAGTHARVAPLTLQTNIELLTYAVGDIDLGELVVAARPQDPDAQRVSLGVARVVENMRPRFFDQPVRPALKHLESAYQRAAAGGLSCVGVLGSAGSGKSRLCEEFTLGRRRHGARIITAHQAKSVDDQQRLLAELCLGLAGIEYSPAAPAETVLAKVAQFEPDLADRAEVAVRSIFGLTTRNGATPVDQNLLSVLVVLVAAVVQEEPLILHLQDLHWSNAEMLQLLGRFIWQLGLVLGDGRKTSAPYGVVVLLEGRRHERPAAVEESWSSEQFEHFLVGIEAETVFCRPYDATEGREFIARLFEQPHARTPRTSPHLKALQSELIDTIDRSAGSNPFHALEQIRLLKELDIVAQNPVTGLLYLIKSPPQETPAPSTVTEAIRRRWEYLRAHNPRLALLIRAAALVDDHLPAGLFARLRHELAPDLGLAEIEATELLAAVNEDSEVTFRHENYWQAIRGFTVSDGDIERIVAAYVGWYLSARRLTPSDRFRVARALLTLPRPDGTRIQRHLTVALRGASGEGDVRLARRIATQALDLRWQEDASKSLAGGLFERCCDEELELVGELIRSDRRRASERLAALSRRLSDRLARRRATSDTPDLRRREVAGQVLRSQILFNDRRPMLAAEVAHGAINEIRSMRVAEDHARLAELEMEGLHCEAVALALSGAIDQALERSHEAITLAQDIGGSSGVNVVATYANILLARDTQQSESILRDLLSRAAEESGNTEPASAPIEINLAMALVLQAVDEGNGLLEGVGEARQRLKAVFARTYRLGLYPDAAAAALMLGVTSVLSGDGDEVSWFAQSVAAATRGGQIETLWRAHINLATALRAAGEIPSGAVRDHAHAALELMLESLAPYPEPDQSPRFELLRAPMTQSVRLLIAGKDELAGVALERLPALRALTSEEYRAGAGRASGSHEWIPVGEAGYVIY